MALQQLFPRGLLHTKHLVKWRVVSVVASAHPYEQGFSDDSHNPQKKSLPGFWQIGILVVHLL
jgi:hypothetical protein